MNLVRLVLRSSKGMAVLAAMVGMAGGAGSCGLLALIQLALSRDGTHNFFLAWGFADVCLGVLLTRVASQVLLIRLSQGAVFEFYERLSRQILAAPLRVLEEIGPHRLLANLTEDVPVIANAYVGLPVLCMNGAAVTCCLIYIGWLSLTALLAVLAFLTLGIASYQVLASAAMNHLRAARNEHDSLLRNFRSLMEGV